MAAHCEVSCLVTIMKIYACKFCQKDFENGMKLGGHMTWCSSNPARVQSSEKISAHRSRSKLSEEHKLHIAQTIAQKLREGNWHNSFARCRKQTYAGQVFDGTWEVMLAKWFDDNQIAWVRNKDSFPYLFEGKNRRYVPDFYILGIRCYVEVKGWKTLKDEAKWSQFKHKLIILSGSDLKSLGLNVNICKDWK
jgi:hypothetical protein